MDDPKYLRSRRRRGRWFHYYRRAGKEMSLGVHGLHPTDPKVFTAYCVQHARWEDRPLEAKSPKINTFAWGVELYQATNWEWNNKYSVMTRKGRAAIYARYTAAQGDRPISTITTEDLEAALYAKGGFGAISDLKALKPVFKHLKRLKYIDIDPATGVKLDKPKSDGFPTANADDIEKYLNRWPQGSVQRRVFELGLLTGAARQDLARIGPGDLNGRLLTFKRHKTKVETNVPITPELRRLLDQTPDGAAAFITNSRGQPYKPASLGNLYGDAATAAGIVSRLHGLRKAFCVYWAEQGMTTHQIATMAGHQTLTEVERYTKAADRKRIIRLIVDAT
ncbi:tyrosine-type recombinase/integrase [Epibacterium ulvae]|uniref:tyrosine-type recombinase/integrase n=1 Tax=Epibacterium ulvae TaxID=1156985 RepID=UPI001BFBFF66|nr:tyrosine-type recombinase/integrase [Epibacterium ulvae]MBT8152720.1 tyrosine-type recombinase/integrase [Epibacterium ulvae]